MLLKIPITIACSLIAFALGALAGVGTLAGLGYEPKPESHSSRDPNNGGGAPMVPGARMPGNGPGGGPGGGGGGRPGGGGGGPGGGGGGGGISKIQLAGFLNKLDDLTQKPLFVELTADQKKKVSEQIQGLAELEDLKDDEAKKRLDALAELLNDKKGTLEKAGLRWPGSGGPGGGGPGGGGGRPQAPANPFKEGDANTHLKSLAATLAK
jgi:hypothetical protein